MKLMSEKFPPYFWQYSKIVRLEEKNYYLIKSSDSVFFKCFNIVRLGLEIIKTTLSHNVVSSTPRHEQVQTHNFRGDRLLLHR
jgi:hypothetical protein